MNKEFLGRYYCVCLDTTNCVCGYFEPRDPKAFELIDNSIKKSIKNSQSRAAHKTPAGKKTLAKAHVRYMQTEKGRRASKKARVKYESSDKAKLTRKLYMRKYRKKIEARNDR